MPAPSPQLHPGVPAGPAPGHRRVVVCPACRSERPATAVPRELDVPGLPSDALPPQLVYACDACGATAMLPPPATAALRTAIRAARRPTHRTGPDAGGAR